jgi:membrane-associated protein
MIGNFINIILHIDKYLSVIINNYGTAVYFFLFVVVFCETGLVVIPFLPGDSLLFAASAFAAAGLLDIKLIFIIFAAAAIMGDTVNYHIGHFVGPKVFSREDSRWLKKEHLERTHGFYEKHGPVTIIIARFMPIIRTFAPFVAGIGNMSYLKFISYNVVGGILWVSLFAIAGFFFGNIPFIKSHFTTVIYGIIVVSLFPAMIGFAKSKLKAQTE